MFFHKKFKKYTDEELMLFIGNNDSRAFEELYNRYGKKIHYYFYKMLGYDSEKANDFTQDLFLKIIERNDSFDKGMKLQTWLYTIATNMCKNEYKHKEIRLKHVEDYKYTANTISLNEFDNTYDQNIFKQNLERELGELEISHKTTFILRYQQELSIKEIAEIMDCSEGTVKSRIFYTLQKLSIRLKSFNQLLEKDIWKSN